MLHRHVEDAVLGAAAVEDRDDVRVIQPRGDGPFEREAPVESPGRLAASDLVGPEELDRAGPPEGSLFRAIHRGHAAARDERREAETVTDPSPDEGIGQKAFGCC
jgi:hypothetical protein